MMNLSKRYFSLLTSCLTSACIFACSGCIAQQEKDDSKIGLALYDAHDTFISELASHFHDHVKSSNGKVQLESYDASGSQYTQNTQVQQLIDNGCDVLCVNPVDRTAPGKIIELARESNTPVIFFNREPVEEDLKQWDHIYYVGSSAQGSGTMQGEIAASYIQSHPNTDKNKDGVIQYVILEGEPGHQDSIMRSEESVEALEHAGIKLKKVDYAIANWSRQQAQTKVEQILDKPIEMILANNDAMAAGAVSAYEKASIPRVDRPIIFGFDGTQEGLKLMENEQIVGTVYNNSKKQADAMYQLAEDLAKNDSLQDVRLENNRYIYIPYKKISYDTLDQYLNDDQTQDFTSSDISIHPNRQ